MDGERPQLRVVPRPPDGPSFSDGEPPEGMEDLGSALARGDHVELGRLLLGELVATAPTTHTSGAWWQYETERGVWGELRAEELDRITVERAGSVVRNEKKRLKLRASDVNGARKIAETLAASPGHFDDALPGVAFSNGFALVSADGVRLAGHAPGHRARHAYDFPLSLQSECAFSRFLQGCFEGEEDSENKVRTIREFIGACIVGQATRFQTSLVLVGSGSNGKGVTTQAIEACMPPGSVVAVPPQRMSGEYYRARLAGKLLNSVSELPEQDIIDSDTFKAIISGDTIEARNPTEKPFSYRPIAGHIYACNRLPGTTDQSHGFWRRFIVLKYGKTFAVDSGFSEGIIADVAGTVGWALAGVPELLARARFDVPVSSDALKREWRMSSDQVAVFFEETLEPSADEWIQSRELYRLYKEWATENGHRAMASNKFGERMHLLGYPARHTRTGNVYDVRKRIGSDDGRAWSWNGQ